MTDRWDDPELERLMKEGLERRAGQVDVDVAVADRARAAAGGARWRTAAAVGLIAASVAAVAGGVVLLRDDDNRSGGVSGDPTTPTVVDEWRTEYWHGIQVDVPADWGWGGSPMLQSYERELGGDMLVACAAGAFKAPGLSDREIDWETTPYVGRPFALTDVCEIFRDGQWREPEAPYLWFGTPIEPGIREFGNGYVQETIEFEGEPVTVATNDPALREQILDTVQATPADGPCDATWDGDLGPFAGTTEGYAMGDLEPMSICVYRDDQTGVQRLAYATTVDPNAAEQFRSALDEAPATVPEDDCPRPEADWFEFVVLTVRGIDQFGDGPMEVRYGVDTSPCPGISTQGLTTRKALTQADVSPWAVDGVPAIVSGPPSGVEWMNDYFLGPQG